MHSKLENYRKIKVRTIYMEMLNKPVIDLILPENTVFNRKINIDTEEYKYFYRKVGDFWGWSGRLIISDDDLRMVLDNPQNEIYFLTVENNFAGFFELFRHSNEDVELVYMGLSFEFIGKGLGKILLNQAIKTAWNSTTKRFWLHTCEFDHQNAVEIYQKAGFEIFKQQTDEEYYPVEFLKRSGIKFQ